jgi:hypothetical protein
MLSATPVSDRILNRVSTWLLAVVLLVQFGFLAHFAWALHMHPDEDLSFQSTNGDLIDVIRYQQSLHDNQAPLWFILFRVWRTLIGDHEYTSRIFGILCSLIAIALTVRISRMMLPQSGCRIGLLAGLLLLGNGLFFHYALDIRPYPLVMLVAALSLCALVHWVQRGTWRAAARYGLTIAAMFYTHYLLMLFVAAQLLFVPFALRHPVRARGRSRRYAAQLALACACAAALSSFWVPTFIAQVQHLRAVEATTGTGRGVAGIGVSTERTTLETVVELMHAATNQLPVLYGGLLVAGAVLVRRCAALRPAFLLAIVWALVTPAMYLAANTVAAVYAPRFVSHCTLGLALACALAVYMLAARAARYRAVIAVAAACGLLVPTLIGFPQQLPSRTPYRDILGQISDHYHAGDAILLVRAGDDNPFVARQLYRYLHAPAQAAITHDSRSASEARRVWYVTGDLFDATVRREFTRLEPTHPVRRVLGDCNRFWCFVAQEMLAPPFHTPIRFTDAESGNVVPFYGADLDRDAAGLLRADLWWRVETALTRDYSIALHLLNTEGMLIAQHDGPIHHYGVEVVQTSAMQLGRIYVDERALVLPADLPAGTYTPFVLVYRFWDGLRLRVESGQADAVALEPITIP